MIRSIVRSLFCGVLALPMAAGAFAQFEDWSDYCVDPSQTTLTGYFQGEITTSLMGAAVGKSGSWFAYGGSDTAQFCFGTPVGYHGESTGTSTPNIGGGFALKLGSTFDNNGNLQTDRGSVQTGLDDGMVLNFGGMAAPANPWSYVMVRIDGANVALGDYDIQFIGDSDRYLYQEQTVGGDVRLRLRVDIVGDAARFQYTLANTSQTTPHTLGLWLGQFMAMLRNDGAVSGILSSPGGGAYLHRGASQEGFVTMPNNNPPRVETRLKRADDSAKFPSYVNFLFGQSLPYGLRLETGPLDNKIFDTLIHDPNAANGTDGTEADNQGADEFALGYEAYLLGGPITSSTMPDQFYAGSITDINPLLDLGYILKYDDTGNTVAPGSERVIVQYFRSTWSNADYRLPYATVVDAPRLIQPSVTDATQLTPNPATVRVHVDNTAGYSNYSTLVPLNNVRVTLTTPKSTGLAFAAGDNAQESVKVFNGVSQTVRYATKTISAIAARTMRHVDFTLTPDPSKPGYLPYEVKIEPSPGPVRTLTGTIYSSATPRLNLKAGANLVTVPWNFIDNSWTKILDSQPGAFTIYNWDSTLKGYIPATSAERGAGQWIVSNSDYPAISMSQSPTIPKDVVSGFRNITLKPGWNLLGNPYNYPVRLGELAGVSSANPDRAFIWKDLVQQGFVSSSIAYWDATTQTYQFIQGDEALLQPQTGYWIFVPTTGNLTLRFAASTFEGVPVESITANLQTKVWNTGTQNWRLNLVASTATSLDSSNYVGRVANSTEVAQMATRKPPISPVQEVQVSMEQTLNGSTSRLAHAYTDSAGASEFKMLVYTPKAVGRVKLTWPNIAQVSKNMRFRLVDTSTGASLDMRQTSGFDFESKEETTRVFKVQVDAGGTSRAVIGNVIAARQGRDRNSSFAITYVLSSDATTTVRILSGTGREIYSISKGRADRSGQNTVTWNLKDNANRAVAPGVYHVEVLAQTTTGEAMRRTVPINVVR